MGTGAKYREAGAGDVSELVRVINRAYRVEDFFIDGDRTHEADVRARMAKVGAAFLVIDTPGNGTGPLQGAVYVIADDKRGHVGPLAVHPDCQGRGIGRALIQAAEAYCKSHGCDRLHLDIVNLRQELPRFYEQLGFSSIGTDAFPEPHRLRREAHVLLMSKPL